MKEENQSFTFGIVILTGIFIIVLTCMYYSHEEKMATIKQTHESR